MDKDNSTIRLSQAAKSLNIGSRTVVDYLRTKNFTIEDNPNVKITQEQYALLTTNFKSSIQEQPPTLPHNTQQADYLDERITLSKTRPKQLEKKETVIPTLKGATFLGKAEPTAALNRRPKGGISEERINSASSSNFESKRISSLEPTIKDPEQIKFNQVIKPPVEKIDLQGAHKLQGVTFLGKMDIVPERERSTFTKETPAISSHKSYGNDERPSSTSQSFERDKKPFKQFSKDKKPVVQKKFVSEQEVQEKLKLTLAKLNQPKEKESSRSKFRKQKRLDVEQANMELAAEREQELGKLRVSEFASPSDLASLMDVPVNRIIETCVSIGIVVSINQRLDAEVISIVAEEFGYKPEFIDVKEETEEEIDNPDDLVTRAPIVTIMGHVDHGKTSLLDYIHNLNITKSEAGGITQHIGAYDVTTKSGHKIAFIDTPGHEAFTAMRARGAKITDIVVIVIAADDRVMPQTQEAISHAQAAGVPMVIALNKIDRPTANPDKIKEQLANIGILVEDWGGKYQCECISAKTGEGIDSLLQKILLEAEILSLKANPNRAARGTVLESSIEKGRGYVSTIMIQNGTLKIGDPIIVGAYFGKVKAMKNHLGENQKTAPPSTPLRVMGIEGAPQAGDPVKVMPSERDAREIAARRQQLLREQNLRVKKHISLDEIGRRIAIGNFQELKVIVKGDVDGSIEALSDSLIKLSTESFKLSVIHKNVGAISESDVLLASAADAIIVGFQVRPSVNAKQLAAKEGIDIRLYSVIYDAIESIRDAMEGMLAPTIQENITANVVVRAIFKISKIGTIAGCYVTSGSIKRQHKIRVIRDGIVLITSTIAQLKREKEDVKEVKHGLECGININGFDDIRVDDVIEAFEEVEVESKL